MRPVIKDFLDALTANPSERLEGRELDRHHFAILEGYHRETQAVRESFLNDDVRNLLLRDYYDIESYKWEEWLASDKGRERREALGFEKRTPRSDQERETLLYRFHDIEFMAYLITKDVYEQFKLVLNDEVMAIGDKLKRGDMTFSNEVRTYIYKMKPQDTPPSPEPQPLPTMATDRTAKDLTRIFTDLQDEGFISQESRLVDWLTAWGKADDEASTPEQREPFKRIVWIKTNSLNRQPSKRSLLDLLLIMGYDVTFDTINSGGEIEKRKDVVNLLFYVPGTPHNIVRNDTNRFIRVGYKSEYHDLLERIATKGK